MLSKSLIPHPPLPMRILSPIPSNEDGLQKVQLAVKEHCEERTLAAISDCKFNAAEIHKIYLKLKVYVDILEEEKYLLTQYSQEFLLCYPKDGKGRYNTAKNLSKQMFKTLTALKQVYRTFTKQQRDKYRPIQHIPAKKRTIYERSLLNFMPYSKDMFGVDSYGEEVQQLIELLDCFFMAVCDIFTIASKVLIEEKHMCKDKNRVIEIYNESFKQIEEEIFRMWNFISHNPPQTAADELTKAFLTKGCYSDFIPKNYHQYTKEQFRAHVLAVLLTRAARQDITQEEYDLFGNDRRKIAEVRTVIAHFDELEPEGQKGKLSGEIVYLFRSWCDIHNKNKWYNYFKNKYQGQYKMISPATINESEYSHAQFNITARMASLNEKINVLLTKYANEVQAFATAS